MQQIRKIFKILKMSEPQPPQPFQQQGLGNTRFCMIKRCEHAKGTRSKNVKMFWYVQMFCIVGIRDDTECIDQKIFVVLLLNGLCLLRAFDLISIDFC